MEWPRAALYLLPAAEALSPFSKQENHIFLSIHPLVASTQNRAPLLPT